MSLTDDQKSELAKPLKQANVKSRAQSGRQLSYVEGWHVIAEANRIFGFDGWTRETIDLKCVSERDREIGAGKAPGFSVTYIAKVRVCAAGIVREGCGTGHGIDRDLGQAHESALKESETDAMKRAMMTFGNVFGLALYDKEQANVEDTPPARQSNVTSGPQEKTSPEAEDIMSKIDLCATERALMTYGETTKADVAKLRDRDHELVRLRFKSRLTKLRESKAA